MSGTVIGLMIVVIFIVGALFAVLYLAKKKNKIEPGKGGGVEPKKEENKITKG